ncbi:MAG: Rab family GTPase [Promethearchaeota archaeon]
MSFKLCVFGAKGSGKSAIIYKLISAKLKTQMELGRTLGADIILKQITRVGKKILLQIWDIIGEKQFRMMLPIYSRGAAGAILVFDMSREESIDESKEWLELFKSGQETIQPRIPIILAGNKADLVENRSLIYQRAKKLVIDHDLIEYMEVSAKTGENIQELFTTLIDTILIERGFY